jgi:hypothetical protein
VAFEFLNSITLKIEMIDFKDNIMEISFPQRPACFFLTDKTKELYRKYCRIQDSNTKMRDLMDAFTRMKIEMEYEH